MEKSELPLSSLSGFPSLGESSKAPLHPPVPGGAWGLRAAAAKMAEATEAHKPSESPKPLKEEERQNPVAGSGGEPAGSSATQRAASPRSPKTISTCAEAPAHDANDEGTDEENHESASGSHGDVSGEEDASGGAPEEPGGEWAQQGSPNWNKVDSPESSEASLRHFLAPLSREQLLDLLSWAALRDRAVYQHCADRVHASPSSRRLMVRNVHFNTSDERFTSFFETFGCVDDALIVRERDGHSRGYGFVTFAFPEGVNRCFVACPLTLDGRQLHIKLAADLFTSREQTKLFVRNLHDQTTAETLREIFSPFGTLEECVVVRDAEGRSKGYGFLNFSTPMEAFKAVQMSERIIDGRMVFIHFASSSAKGGSKAGAHAARSNIQPTHSGSKQNSMPSQRRTAAPGGAAGGFSLRVPPMHPGAACHNWEYAEGPHEPRQRHRKTGADHQRGSYISPHRVPIGRCMGGSAGDPLVYPDGAFGDLYGFSLPPFPFLTPSQAPDVKSPLSAAYAQFYSYPVGPYYPLAPDGQPPYGAHTVTK
ncbi:polyadenylate-binding protein 4 [Cyclospora cayetanensis]|uniref:Polyadenylate-binding protein 4 n=1 Tax=Cyclospora cayetanensis TaxID=88456 RepID=A0A6P5WDZ1_9EIME|nr:polyadenylate-binding protein 4 [Cyclospora cayetanensis]